MTDETDSGYRIAAAIQQQGEYEPADAGPKEPYVSAPYKGIVIASRHSIKSEFEHMRRAIDAMRELMARRIESIWCDSKVGAYFVVVTKPGLYAPELPAAVMEAFRSVGGYNGISVHGDEGELQDFASYWPSDAEVLAQFADAPVPPSTDEIQF